MAYLTAGQIQMIRLAHDRNVQVVEDLGGDPNPQIQGMVHRAQGAVDAYSAVLELVDRQSSAMLQILAGR